MYTKFHFLVLLWPQFTGFPIVVVAWGGASPSFDFFSNHPPHPFKTDALHEVLPPNFKMKLPLQKTKPSIET